MESQSELYTLIYMVVLLWLGFKNWSLSSELSLLEEQNDTQHNMILAMAEELEKLGSPNVSVKAIPAYNIKYDK
jgi:hypothetical protein